MIDFDIRVNDKHIDDDLLKNLENIADFLFKEEGVFLDYYINVIICNRDFIKEINHQYRRVNKVTDVLSFPLIEYPKGKVFKDAYKENAFSKEYFIEDLLYLGDILICMDKVVEQSKEYGTSIFREISYLMVHSFLHLLGYDHILDDDKKKMRMREEFLLESFIG